MIKEMLERYGSNHSKVWTTNRLATVGSSEIGQCIRKIGFAKFETVPDAEYEDGWGAALRGTIIEDHFWVPALRASLEIMYGGGEDAPKLLYAGEEQRTFALGFLSATPDGLITEMERDCLSHLGVDDIGPGRCVIVECKSIDPRSQERLPKEEHSYQVNTALGLIRDLTDHQPEHAVITYIDASFLDNIREFVIKFDEGRYKAAEAGRGRRSPASHRWICYRKVNWRRQRVPVLSVAATVRCRAVGAIALGQRCPTAAGRS